MAVDLAGDVALEDADDLALGATLFHSALHVGLGLGIRRQPGDHDGPQGAVGLSIPAAVEPVAGDLARGSLERRDPAQVGPGGF